MSQQQPQLQKLFLSFLEGPARSAKALYILGDLFDVWVGSDLQTPFHTQIQEALYSLHTNGIQLFFMNGNRDFLLENAFLKKVGCQRLKDPSVISLHGVPTLLMHGDKLCTQDIAYQRYRRIAQHPLTRFLFLKLPKSKREKIALKLRQKSKQYQQAQHETILDVTQDAVMKVMSQYHCHQLIHGHVHRPKVHDLFIEGKAAKRIVLGDWYHTGSVIVATEQKTTLAVYDLQSGLNEIDAYRPLPAFLPPSALGASGVGA